MSFEEPNPKIPMGLASKLEASKETLPAIEVKNKVLWVNPGLDLPFDLEVGKSTKLGLFLNNRTNDGQKSNNLEVKYNHGRSALLGRVIFGEKAKIENRQLYRDIDIKGLGYVDSSGPPALAIGKITTMYDNSGSYGILSPEDAFHDRDVSEEFHQYGIRTPRVIAIVALEEIIDEGNFISISEAQKKNLIPENLKPVLEIRAFGTHVRLVDTFAGRSSRGKDGLFIEDARWLIAQELGKDIQHFDKLAYFKWLATTIGKNLGLMHKNKWIHKYLGMGHNITLDGCFVDFDSVEYLESPQRDAFEYDYNETRNALSKLLIFLGQTFSDSAQKDIINNFKTAYRENKY